jgi:hypothetical protein
LIRWRQVLVADFQHCQHEEATEHQLSAGRQVMDISTSTGQHCGAIWRVPNLPATGHLCPAHLEEKGHIRHLEQGPRYLYEPIQDRERARDSALQHLVETFFDGSPERAVSALLDSRKRLDPAALARIAARLKQEREKGR